jgi:lysophospholipase L1-like esterase
VDSSPRNLPSGARRRRRLYGAAAVVIGVLVATGLLLAADLYVHQRHAQRTTLNIWGYRGTLVRHKRHDERRVVVVGGSTVFGYGVLPEEAFPARLEQEMTRRPQPVSIVNLGAMGENAYAFRTVLQDYRYLDYDAVVLYEGYNNLEATPPIVRRHESSVYRLTGYYPLLPLVVREKIMALRYHGDITEGYRNQRRTVFRPSWTGRASAGAAAVIASLEQQVGRLTRHAAPNDAAITSTSGGPWAAYCNAMRRTIEYARARGKPVMVVTQPYVSDRHIEQQKALRAALQQYFSTDRSVRYVDLGGAINLRDETLSFDGLHLTPAGNERIARLLADPLVALLDKGL